MVILNFLKPLFSPKDKKAGLNIIFCYKAQAHHVSTMKRSARYLNLKLVLVVEMVETPDDDDEFM